MFPVILTATSKDGVCKTEQVALHTSSQEERKIQTQSPKYMQAHRLIFSPTDRMCAESVASNADDSLVRRGHM